MSIHKSQGSEFNHVIIPMSKEYNRMLYNKLLYTGVSRAKKSLVIIGDSNAFMYAVKNSYSKERKTSLTELIMNKFNVQEHNSNGADTMKKIMNAIAVSTTLGCVAATSYFIMKNKKKNMLDIIIEEIETIK